MATYENQDAIRMTISTAPGAIVNPIIAAMQGQSAANALVMDITQDVTVDVVFDAVLTQAESVAFLNGFSITNEGAVDLTDRAAIRAGAVPVDISSGALATALENALNDVQTGAASCAGDNDVNSTHNLKSYFSELVRDVVNSQLKTSGLSKILNTSAVFNVDVSFNETGAAEDMGTKLCGSSAVDGLIPAEVRKSFLMQIPDAELQAYLRTISGATEVNFLPMKGGQSITFVFNTTVTDPGQLTLISSNTGSTTGALNWGTATSSTATTLAPGSGVLDASIVRRVAVIVHLFNKDVYFQRSYAAEDLATLSQEIKTDASHELYGLSNEIEYFSAELAKLPYVLRVAAANDDAATGGYNAKSAELATAGTAAGSAITSDLSLGQLIIDEVTANIGHNAPVSTILAISSLTEETVVEYNKALASFLKATGDYNTNVLAPYQLAAAADPTTAVPAPIDPQHANRLESAKAAFETAAANDRYLSSTVHQMVRDRMESNSLVNATLALTGAAPYYTGYVPIDMLPATRTAIAAYNTALQAFAIEASVKSYYDSTHAAISSAPLIDRDGFERPVLASSAGLPMSYTPTIAPAAAANDYAQHV